MKSCVIKAILPLALVCSCACSGSDGYGKEDCKHVDSAEMKDGIVTIHPFEYYNAFRNPMKGWREFFCPGVDTKRTEYPYPYGSMVKEYMQWNMMENVESDGVDKIIAYSDYRWKGVEDQNIKVIPRPFIIWMEPYEGGYAKNTFNPHPDDLNGWHWPSDFPGEEISNDENTPTKGGYFAPEFPDRMKKLIKKLGEAWDNDPRVAYVEVGLIGEWGEHHDPCITDYWAPIFQKNHVAGRTWIPGIEKVLGDAFTEAFKNKKVMVRYAYDFQDYDFGYYWDSFAYEDEQERGYNWYMRRGDFWKRQPMGGEITWNYWSYKQQGIKNLEGVLANSSRKQSIIDDVRALHVNHLGGVTWANFKDDKFLSNAGDIQKIMGYHYVLKEFSYPSRIEKGIPFDIVFSVVNTGSSPFYYDWPVEISLLDTETHLAVWKCTLSSPKISQWLPGDKWDASTQRYLIPAETYTIRESITIDEDIPNGKYAIALSVLDPAGNLPSLRFAAYNYWNGGRHPMGYVGIGENIDSYGISFSDFDDLQSDRSLHYVVK